MMTRLRKSIIVLTLAISGIVMIIVFIGLLCVGSKLLLPSLAGLGFLLICTAMFAGADIITFEESDLIFEESDPDE